MERASRRGPDGEPTLAFGAVVRAHVVARLFGVRLLRLDATVVVSPPPVEPAGRGSAGDVVLGTTVARGARLAGPAPSRDGG
ncbi:hypothetical protein, partial [Mumia xiangluensis]